MTEAKACSRLWKTPKFLNFLVSHASESRVQTTVLSSLFSFHASKRQQHMNKLQIHDKNMFELSVLSCSTVPLVIITQTSPGYLGVSGTMMDRSGKRTSDGSSRQPRFRPTGLSGGSGEHRPSANGSSMASSRSHTAAPRFCDHLESALIWRGS